MAADARYLDRWALGILALVALIVAACSGGGTQPFAKVDGGPTGKPVPPIGLGTVDGLPPDKFQALKDALSISAGKRDMAIVEGSFDQGELKLTGNFQIIPDPAAVRVGYSWTLTDNAGTVLHNIAAEEIAPGAPGPDPWAQVTPAVLQRIAAYPAENLSSRLSQMGYATQVGGIPPPLDSFMMAGHDADKDIDYETLNGPGKGDLTLPPGATATESVMVRQAPMGDEAPKAETTETAETEAANLPPPPPPPEGGAAPIKAVAVIPVSGASDSGNRELTRAMRRMLQDAGWPVLDQPRRDARTIAGKVALGEKNGTTQKVALAWTVKSPDGRMLGSVKQANRVPVGLLDAAWGKNADYAAEAAATGIFDLVKKIR